MITSRIAGYREIQRIPEDEFAHFTVRDFDDDQIGAFARNWHRARGSTQAEAEAASLVEATDRNSKVKQLAANPLMLTIIAIVHEGNTRLPNRRIQLYDQCIQTLLFSWRERRKNPPLTSVDGAPITDVEARRRLEQLAYWMHSSASAESDEPVHVKRVQLKTEMAKQLVGRKNMDRDEAEAEAEHFLEYIRGHTGVLLERGTELYAFVHLTFQEYFAAWDISRRSRGDADKVWKQIHSCQHDSHWREVILLLIAKLDEQYPDEIGEELIQKILNAESRYGYILKRDMFLAGACLADDVTAKAGTYERVLDEIVDAAMHSPHRIQREYAADMLGDLLNSHYGDTVTSRFLDRLSEDDSEVRGSAVDALRRIGKADERVIQKLAELLSDDDSFMLGRAVDARRRIGRADERVMEGPEVPSDNSYVRWSAAYALGRIGKADERAIQKLEELLSDVDSDVRWRAADALGRIGVLDERVLDCLKGICEDHEEHSMVAPGPEWDVSPMLVYDWAFRTLWRHAPLK